MENIQSLVSHYRVMVLMLGAEVIGLMVRREVHVKHRFAQSLRIAGMSGWCFPPDVRVYCVRSSALTKGAHIQSHNHDIIYGVHDC